MTLSQEYRQVKKAGFKGTFDDYRRYRVQQELRQSTINQLMKNGNTRDDMLNDMLKIMETELTQ